MPKLIPNSRRLLAILGAVVLGLAVSACGNKTAHPTTPPAVDGSASSGFYFDAGKITYQVQLSRELNPYATEDKAYLMGVQPADLTLAPADLWFVVTLWATNQSKTAATTSDHFTITDTQGNTYNPVPLNSGVNALAWTPMLLRPHQTEPPADSLASYSPTQGAELLFKINNSAYSNRPLTLNVYAPGQSKPSQIALDL
ncbi:MAG: hypothetical protein ACYDHH_20750 [Solirubrobacteraceae bacterium]